MSQEYPETNHAKLLKFYDVKTLEELVDAQAYHIERLQSKLPQIPDIFPPKNPRG